MNNPFITEVKIKDKPISEYNEQFERVRGEHAKLMAAVMKYNEKIALLQDKQRQEYITAYEHHMINVQKELHTLREKATAIANDRTRDEKLKKLDLDTQSFRNESLRLDMVSNELRKTLRAMTSTLQTVERERDWLLKKLQQAKKKYKRIRTEYETVMGRSQGDDSNSNSHLPSLFSSSQGSASIAINKRGNNSSSNISVVTTPGQLLGRLPDWKSRLEAEFVVTRADTALFALPSPSPAVPSRATVMRQLAEARKQEEKEALNELVLAKARREALYDLVHQCRRFSAVGASLSKSFVKKRPLVSVLRDCIDLMEGSESRSALGLEPGSASLSISASGSIPPGKSMEGRVEDLAAELACYPETYDIISHLLNSYKGPSPHDDVVASVEEGESDVLGEDVVRDEVVEQDKDGLLVMDQDIMRYFQKQMKA